MQHFIKILSKYLLYLNILFTTRLSGDIGMTTSVSQPIADTLV